MFFAYFKGLKIPRTRVRAGSSPATSTIETGEIHKISPVLLCLGSNWEVILARFYPQADGFVCYLQFIFNFVSVQYNIRDLDVKICVSERNKLIVDTWLKYVKDKRTVVFCASIKHAEQIADLFKKAGVNAVAVSGGMASYLLIVGKFSFMLEIVILK